MPEDGIRALRDAGVVATLLPNAAFYLKLGRFAPARALIDAGVPVALATDVNPGGGFSPSMPFAMTLACFGMGLTFEEALAAATINGAYSLDRDASVGSLEPGKLMDAVLVAGDAIDLIRVGARVHRRRHQARPHGLDRRSILNHDTDRHGAVTRSPRGASDRSDPTPGRRIGGGAGGRRRRIAAGDGGGPAQVARGDRRGRRAAEGRRREMRRGCAPSSRRSSIATARPTTWSWRRTRSRRRPTRRRRRDRPRIQAAMREAIAAPLDVMRACAAAAGQGAVVAALGNPSASSDVQVGFELLGAGLRGAKLNVEINLGSVKDAEYVARVRRPRWQALESRLQPESARGVVELEAARLARRGMTLRPFTAYDTLITE